MTERCLAAPCAAVPPVLHSVSVSYRGVVGSGRARYCFFPDLSIQSRARHTEEPQLMAAPRPGREYQKWVQRRARSLPARAHPGASGCVCTTMVAVIRDMQFRARAAAVVLFGTKTKGTRAGQIGKRSIVHLKKGVHF